MPRHPDSTADMEERKAAILSYAPIIQKEYVNKFYTNVYTEDYTTLLIGN